MPRRVTAFACSHGCRRNVITGYDRMAAHEARCFWNPANRACMTCKHDTFEMVDDGSPDSRPWNARYCDLALRGSDGKPVYECDQWEALEVPDAV